MRRDHDALIAYLDDRILMPFAWGRDANDCVSFAVGGIIAQTGRDPLPADFGSWSTRIGAMRVATRHGSIAAACDRLLRPIPPALAMRGDIAGVPHSELGIALTIVEGATLAGPGEVGTDRFARDVMTMAWSIT